MQSASTFFRIRRCTKVTLGLAEASVGPPSMFSTANSGQCPALSLLQGVRNAGQMHTASSSQLPSGRIFEIAKAVVYIIF